MKKKLKSAPIDFDAQMLPHNRREVFFDCLKMRYSVFVWAGLMLLLFALPILMLMLFRDAQVVGLYSAFASGSIAEKELSATLANYRVAFTASLLLLLPIFAVGLAGVIRVLRQLIWGEGIYFAGDFKDGLKENAARYIFIFAVAAVFILGYAVLESYFSYSGNAVRYIIFAVIFIMIFPAGLYITTMTAVYNIKLWACIKNSFILYIRTFPVSALFAALLLGAYFGLIFIPIPLVKYAVLLLLIVFVLPLYLTLWLLYSCYTFDRFINRKSFPEYIDKGVGGRSNKD